MDYNETVKTILNIIDNYKSSLSVICHENKGKSHDELLTAFLVWLRRNNFSDNLSELELMSISLIGWCYVKNLL